MSEHEEALDEIDSILHEFFLNKETPIRADARASLEKATSAIWLEYGKIARVCHAANRAYCQTLPDAMTAPLPWELTSEHTRESITSGVLFLANNPDATPSDMHDEWCNFKYDAGWRYDVATDHAKKTHPALRPYSELSGKDKIKDDLFISIALALLD